MAYNSVTQEVCIRKERDQMLEKRGDLKLYVGTRRACQ